jgi:hypothetical protein
MSIGNLKDSGNQGNNFPWQLKMLLGQQCACDQLTEIAGNTDDIEFILTSILTTLQAGTEYEAKFVLETCDGEPPTTRVLLEVRVWNTDTGTWEPPTYYLPGSTTPIVPTPPDAGCTLEYTDPSGALAMIYNELQTQTTILTDIEGDTTSIDATLTNLFAAYSAGQQACASSLSVTLCTEQGTDLANIDTNTANTVTELTDVNTTLASILADTTIISNLDFATETTLNLALTTLGSILAQLDVDLSTRASEITLAALLTAFNAENFATETTLLTRLSKADFEARINTFGQKLMAASTPVVLASDQAAIPVTFPTGTNTPTLLLQGDVGTLFSGSEISISIQNLGSTTITYGGQGIPPGVSVSWDAAEGKTLSAAPISSGGVGTSYLVTTVY